MNIQQALFFSFIEKTRPINQKKFTNFSYLIMVLIKMKLLIFLVLSWYGLASKYRIISQRSIYNWMQNCNFQYLWYCIFIFLRSNYKLLRQVRLFVTWWVESIIISSDSNLSQKIIRETIKVGEKNMDQGRIPRHSRLIGTFRIWLKLLGNSQSSTTKKRINKRNILS